MTTSRFFFEPNRQSIGDKLLEHATRLRIELYRSDDGMFAEIELRAQVGTDIFDDTATDLEKQAQSAEAMQMARSALAGFAAAKGGDA